MVCVDLYSCVLRRCVFYDRQNIFFTDRANTDATGFTLSIAQFGGSSSQRRLFYIDPGGTLFKLTFSRRPEDYDPSHPDRPSTIDYDAPFESGGATFLLKHWEKYTIEDDSGLKTYPDPGLQQIKDIIEKTKFGICLSEATRLPMHRYYLRRLSVHQLDPEEISYLAELIGTSGFEKFSDDYFYSHLEHFLGLLSYGSSHYEMTTHTAICKKSSNICRQDAGWLQADLRMG